MDATQIIVLLLGIIVGGMNITIFISIFKLYLKSLDNAKDIEARLKELDICKQDKVYFTEGNEKYTIQELSKMLGISCEDLLKMDKKKK